MSMVVKNLMRKIASVNDSSVPLQNTAALLEDPRNPAAGITVPNVNPVADQSDMDSDINPAPQMVGEVKNTYNINNPATLQKLAERWKAPITYAIKGPNASRDSRGLYPKGWLDY